MVRDLEHMPVNSALSAAHRRYALATLLSHGTGHLGWCDRDDPETWGAPAWVERVMCGFLETALGIEPADDCETIACEIFD